MKRRAEVFTYSGLDVGQTTLEGHYDLDGRSFTETVRFEGVGDLREPAVRSLAELWYLVAGLSYYKAGAARRIDVGATPLGGAGRTLLTAALHDGLGEFAVRNDLSLDDVRIEGGVAIHAASIALDERRVLTPFGGGIDSVVTVVSLSDTLEQTLFVVSPASGRFAPLEATAAVTGLEVVRATRQLDPQITSGDARLLNGHVPVTAMVTLLAAVAATASGRGGVVMSNEHSASSPNLHWRGRAINHQWSKSLDAELLIAAAIGERVGDALCVASFLRDRSELWVARAFSAQREYHHVFRSCNRAFTQSSERRAAQWCGECDKCLFINLMLAPFLPRSELATIFAREPLSDPAREGQLRTLVGLGVEHKPFECVGDPDESAVALARVSTMPEWSDAVGLARLACEARPVHELDDLLASQGTRRVPAHWLR